MESISSNLKIVTILMILTLTVSSYAIPGRVIYTPKPSGIFYGNGSEYVAQPKGYADNSTPRYQDILIPAATVQKLMNYRWSNPTSDAAQWGAQQAKTEILSLIGLGKTFNGRPVYNTLNANEYYTPLKTNTSLVCMLLQNPLEYGLPKNLGYGIIFNNNLYNITHTYQNTTAWNNTRLEYKRTTDNSVYTYWKDYNYSYTIWNITENWFVSKK